MPRTSQRNSPAEKEYWPAGLRCLYTAIRKTHVPDQAHIRITGIGTGVSDPENPIPLN